MSGYDWALLLAMAGCVLPVLGAAFRHRAGHAWILALVGASTTAVYLGLIARAHFVDPAEPVESRLYALLAWGVPMVLVGYLMTAALGRDDVRGAFRSIRGSFLVLAAAGVVFLSFLRHPSFVSGYRWTEGGGSVVFGTLGKAYLTYLLIGVVFIGHNLESTLRLASGEARERLRGPVLGLFGVLGFFTYALTSGLLYASLDLDPLVAAALPITIANVLVGYGFLRGALTDAAVPVSRNVVYTSFTAFLAGLYVLAVGLFAQLALFTRWSPGEVVSVALGFLLVVTTAAFLFSARLKRRVQRFIDRNFYVNRYDYRSQWFRVTRSLDPALGVEGVVRGAIAIVSDVLRADAVTVSLRDPASDALVPFAGKGKGVLAATLADGSPLYVKLTRERRALLLNRNVEDFEYIPVYVENREWLDATASQAVAPLIVGPYLLGTVGLERRHADDRFSYEDLDLLDNLAGHVAAVLRSVQLAAELAESRETELLSQWSSMLLHDLKNHLSPLRMIARNLVEHRGNVEFQEEAAKDLSRVADQLESLVRRLGELKQDRGMREEQVDLARLLRKCSARLQLERRPGVLVVEEAHVDAGVSADAALIQRIFENLLTNAVEAMDGSGGEVRFGTRLDVRAESGESWVVAWVEDDGPGIPDPVLRDRLFQPFATTKPRGLGLGLYQSRMIARAHGGDLRAVSGTGRGARFELRLRAVGGESADRAEERRISGGQGRRE